MAREGIPLEWLDQIGGGEERGGQRKEKREKGERRRRWREKLHLISRFPGDRMVVCHRSKRQSQSSLRELPVGTRIEKF